MRRLCLGGTRTSKYGCRIFFSCNWLLLEHGISSLRITRFRGWINLNHVWAMYPNKQSRFLLSEANHQVTRKQHPQNSRIFTKALDTRTILFSRQGHWTVSWFCFALDSLASSYGLIGRPAWWWQLYKGVSLTAGTGTKIRSNSLSFFLWCSFPTSVSWSNFSYCVLTVEICRLYIYMLCNCTVIASNFLMTLWHSTNEENVKNSQILHVTLDTSVAWGAIGVGRGTTEIRFDWKASHERPMNLMDDRGLNSHLSKQSCFDVVRLIKKVPESTWNKLSKWISLKHPERISMDIPTA